MELRPYQTDALAGIDDALKHHRSTLVVMATGLGKTVVFSHLIRRFVKSTNQRVMVLAHRAELIQQAAGKIHAITGIRPEIEMADQRADFASSNGLWHSPIVVSSIQTQVAGSGQTRRMHKFKPEQFGLLIPDEAHHTVAPSWRMVINHFQTNPRLKTVGFTATPDRADESALSQIFESVAYEYGIEDGVNDGWLVRPRQGFVPVKGLDFSKCRTTAGDLNGADLAAVLEYEKNLHDIVHPTVERVGNRKALVFAVTVAQAERMAEMFDRYKHDGCARVVTGTTPTEERQQIFADYAANKFQFLCNVGVATEGFDDPGIEVIVMARPTKSRSLYAQMLGRGTRPLPGLVDGKDSIAERFAAIESSPKPHLLVLDFVGNAGSHKLIHAADVLGGKCDEKVIELAIKTKGEHDVLRALSEADRALAAERMKKRQLETQAEREKRKGVVATTQHTFIEIDPFDKFGLTPHRETPWNIGRPATPKQVESLERNGIKNTSRFSFTHAMQLLDEIVARRQAGPATPKQAAALKRHGYDTSQMTFKQASAIMDRLAANGWKPLPDSPAVIAQLPEVIQF